MCVLLVVPAALLFAHYVYSRVFTNHQALYNLNAYARSSVLPAQRARVLVSAGFKVTNVFFAAINVLACA
jgi:hypothetical protein